MDKYITETLAQKIEKPYAKCLERLWRRLLPVNTLYGLKGSLESRSWSKESQGGLSRLGVTKSATTPSQRIRSNPRDFCRVLLILYICVI